MAAPPSLVFILRYESFTFLFFKVKIDNQMRHQKRLTFSFNLEIFSLSQCQASKHVFKASYNILLTNIDEKIEDLLLKSIRPDKKILENFLIASKTLQGLSIYLERHLHEQF